MSMEGTTFSLIVTVIISQSLHVVISQDFLLDFNNSTGYKAEAHQVLTDDGYILKLHRVLKRVDVGRRYPVFLMHGIFMTAADFMLSGPNVGLVYLLADRGYDVWMGNVRGNLFSTTHNTLASDSKKYWNFSWHEMGIYDLPAMVDYALKISNALKVIFVGHSQGTTVLTVLLSSRPDYNSKIFQAHLLAPAVFMSNCPHPAVRPLGQPFKIGMMNGFDNVNFLLPGDLSRIIVKNFCAADRPITNGICWNIVTGIVGKNRRAVEVDAITLETFVQFMSPKISMMQITHFAQSMYSGEFCQFDYGTGNAERYNLSKPPCYDLKKIVVPAFLYHGNDDLLISQTDVELLRDRLPSVIKYRVFDNWNHIDFLFSRNGRTLLYQDMLGYFDYSDFDSMISSAQEFIKKIFG